MKIYKWVAFLTYPHCITYKSQTLLNTIEDLQGVPSFMDRHSNIAEMIEIAHKNGLITIREYFDLRYDVANCI